MVQYTNIVIVASALVACSLPAFAAPLAQDAVELETRQFGLGKIVTTARFATQPARPNTGGFLNSKYNSQRKTRELDEEELQAVTRELEEGEHLQARSMLWKVVRAKAAPRIRTALDSYSQGRPTDRRELDEEDVLQVVTRNLDEGEHLEARFRAIAKLAMRKAAPTIRFLLGKDSQGRPVGRRELDEDILERDYFDELDLD